MGKPCVGNEPQYLWSILVVAVLFALGLLFVGCASQVQENMQQVRDDYDTRMERNLERDKQYCTSLGGTVVLEKMFDYFYVSHCIVGPNPIVIVR